VAAAVGLAGCSTPTVAAASSTSSAAAGAATPPARSVPVRLLIPAIGVDSTLMELGLHDDGTMEVPPAGFPAGWYTGAPTPGELGPAVVAGHVDWTGPGVFYELHKLAAGDEVRVERLDGSTAVFRVTRVAEYRKAAFPTAELSGDIAYAGLRLITCGGSFNKRTGHHEDNIVAFAELVASRWCQSAMCATRRPMTLPWCSFSRLSGISSNVMTVTTGLRSPEPMSS